MALVMIFVSRNVETQLVFPSHKEYLIFTLSFVSRHKFHPPSHSSLYRATTILLLGSKLISIESFLDHFSLTFSELPCSTYSLNSHTFPSASLAHLEVCPNINYRFAFARYLFFYGHPHLFFCSLSSWKIQVDQDYFGGHPSGLTLSAKNSFSAEVSPIPLLIDVSLGEEISSAFFSEIVLQKAAIIQSTSFKPRTQSVLRINSDCIAFSELEKGQLGQE